MWHWSILYCSHQCRNDKSKISKLARFKFEDFSSIFKYFQASYLFSSTFKGLEVFIPNSSIFEDFSSTLWTLKATMRTSLDPCREARVRTDLPDIVIQGVRSTGRDIKVGVRVRRGHRCVYATDGAISKVRRGSGSITAAVAEGVLARTFIARLQTMTQH